MPELSWSRAIVLVDMNAFFASIEQLDFPELRGQPVGVTNGMDGTCIITCSYEARKFGIKTRMRLPKAYALCPQLMRRPSRPTRYAEISSNIMQALQAVTPDIEVFSVDEAFLDITHCQTLHGHPIEIAKRIKQIVFEASGLLCSVGLSGDKTTAKYAASLEKPDSFVVIHPDVAKERLADVPVTKLCGIAKGTKRYLADLGVQACGDMQHIPISKIAARFGNIGRRMWLMCQGLDPEPVHTTVPPPKSLGHGKVMPPNTKDKQVILTYFLHMVEKVASRLRCNHLQAQTFYFALRKQQWGWAGHKYKLTIPTDDSKPLYQCALNFVKNYWHQEPVNQVQVTALDPHSEQHQLDFFNEQSANRDCVNHVADLINAKFGDMTLFPAKLLQRSKMPNVIAPAWKPTGHRRSH